MPKKPAPNWVDNKKTKEMEPSSNIIRNDKNNSSNRHINQQNSRHRYQYKYKILTTQPQTRNASTSSNNSNNNDNDNDNHNNDKDKYWIGIQQETFVTDEQMELLSLD